MEKKKFSTKVGDKTLSVEFNDLADQADGSALVRYGNTTVLATAVMSDKESSMGYFPLIVDYEEKFYASGQILGSRFMRREGRPSDEAILSARLVDRTIRPLFQEGIKNEVQIVITVLSIDEDDPDILAILATSLAIGTSNIPWNGPVSAVRVGKTKGCDEIMINPKYSEREREDNELDLVVCGKENALVMLEAGAKEISEENTEKGLKEASGEIGKIQEFQKKIIKEIGKEKRILNIKKASKETEELFTKEIENILEKNVFTKIPGKESIENLKKQWMEKASMSLPDEDGSLLEEYFEKKMDEAIHKGALEKDLRADGRAMDELRPLYAKAGGISEMLHGSGIFYRGGTHILSVLTLGGPSDALLIDGIEVAQYKKHFMHHYNFPPFSVGEVGRVGGFNRRMIGHGALAEKALSAVIPSKEEFPYTIRIVSEAMASNGSTSMGSVCGSTLALMDAGVPIKAPVAGIAMGLMSEKESGKYKVLTDIQGPEDHYGDMDCKVAGTKEGITAIQMDIKLESVPTEAVIEAIKKAKDARFQILEVIEKEIAKPRENISKNAPEIVMIKIKPDQIGTVIGTGGKIINAIKENTGADIDIEDDGSVFITGKNGGAEKAKEEIEALVKEYKVGEKLSGEVVKITDFGAFVKIGPNTEGLVHISEISPSRIEKVEDILKIGDTVPIIIKDIDDKGRLKLSIKEIDPNFSSKKDK